MAEENNNAVNMTEKQKVKEITDKLVVGLKELCVHPKVLIRNF